MQRSGAHQLLGKMKELGLFHQRGLWKDTQRVCKQIYERVASNLQTPV